MAMILGVATAGFNLFWEANAAIALGVFGGMVFIGLVTIGLDLLTKHKEITTISAVFFGLLIGFLLGQLFWVALKPAAEEIFKNHIDNIEAIGVGVVTLITCYVAVSLLLQTKDEFRFIIPYVEFSKQIKGGRPLVLDTSVIIDGRIADICETGIIDTKLILPRFVLQELQSIADSSDKMKRNRGRRGLDILKKLQSNTKIELEMHEGNIQELRNVQKVDERLVVLAKFLGGRVVTNDFNLNKIAQLQGVEVINLNELANSLKLVALPGEALHLKIIKQGDQPGQGVGYLDDGTMVVVEHGRGAIGQDVTIIVTSVLQTPAGRMIFGKIEGPLSSEKS
ncbi:MAG: PIN/TRAM domain-containing protein [Gemmataceae bacterium]